MSATGGPRIYVADLAAYNNGVLHGVWIDATDEVDEIWAQIRSMLAASPIHGAEEHAVHDYDGFFDLHLGEYESIEHLHSVAVGIAEHGRAFAVWAGLLDRAEWDEQLDSFEDHFEGVYDSYAEFGEQVLELHGLDTDLARLNVPETIRDYLRVDTEALGRDWAEGMQMAWSEGRLYVFFD